MDRSLEKGSPEKNREARGSGGGVKDQLFMTNTDMTLALASVDQQLTSDDLGLIGHAPLAPDRHAVDSQPDAGLSERERAGFLGSVVNENLAMKTNVDKHGPTRGDRPIGIADFDVSSDLSAPSGERAITERTVFNSQKPSRISRQSLS